MKCKNSRGLVCTLVCIALISLMLTGCSTKSEQPSTSSTAGADPVTEESGSNETITAGYGAANIDSDVTIAEDMTIQTRYGDLFFPAQWREFLVTDQTEDTNTIEVSFFAKVNDETYPLFTITIGGDGDTPAGMLTSSDGTQHNVYVQIEEIQESNLLDEGEQNRLYAMQEDINYLLDNLE